MKKIIFLLITISLLQGCGYKSIYSSNYEVFSIEKIDMSKPSKLNNKIKKILNNYQKGDGNKILIKIDSKKIKKIKSKDKNKNASVYEMIINIKINVEKNGKTYNKTLKESIIYNNRDNQFDLRQYEKNIETDLINKIVEKIITFIITS